MNTWRISTLWYPSSFMCFGSLLLPRRYNMSCDIPQLFPKQDVLKTMSSLKTKTYRRPDPRCDPTQPVETDDCAVCLEPFNNNQVGQRSALIYTLWFTLTIPWKMIHVVVVVVVIFFFIVCVPVSPGAALSPRVPQGLCGPLAAAASHLSSVQAQHHRWVTQHLLDVYNGITVWLVKYYTKYIYIF